MFAQRVDFLGTLLICILPVFSFFSSFVDGLSSFSTFCGYSTRSKFLFLLYCCMSTFWVPIRSPKQRSPLLLSLIVPTSSSSRESQYSLVILKILRFKTDFPKVHLRMGFQRIDGCKMRLPKFQWL